MADLLNTTVSGLTAYQTALTTTSHNISNVGTEGYSRQRVELNSRLPQSFGNIHVGQGVNLTDISRVIDEFTTGNIREFSSSFHRLDMFGSFASRVENLIADDQGSLMPALDEFFNAMNDVANDPSANAPRVALLGAAENLDQRFQSLATEMQKMEQEIDDRITYEVGDINALTTEIARINDSIARIGASDNQPSDLLDQREQLLKQLSEKITVSVVEQTDGTLNVLVGSGQLLVTGSHSVNLTTMADAEQPDRLAVAVQSSSGNIDITNNLTGGEIGGLLDFRDNLLDSAQNRLGRTAIAMAESFNNQNVQGYDLNGNLGGNMFSSGNPEVLPNINNNVATGVPTVTVSDATALTVSDYRASFAAGAYTITRESDNTVVAGPAAGPVFANVDGLDFDFSGVGAVAGDSFYIRPTRNGALGFQAQITDPNAIAAASPIRTTSNVANIGDSSISTGTITDVTDANLLDTVDIFFDPANPAGTFDVVDRATATVLQNNVAYTAGMTVSQNGWQVQLTGAAVAGDVLTVEENVGAATDNQNALLLADLRTQQILDNGTTTFEQSYSALTSEVGVVTQQVNINRDVEESLLNSAIAERESISGVNLDEEAADLIRFQQAYQALARVIETANTIFQTLIDVT
ncbi:MAG: flagellar hook-associated protein FlgK [Gammaproteobacteria bacterium]|nr:flagellar hook-associated protein FlgK [Gammaproteobacteria bacterium]